MRRENSRHWRDLRTLFVALFMVAGTVPVAAATSAAALAAPAAAMTRIAETALARGSQATAASSAYEKMVTDAYPAAGPGVSVIVARGGKVLYRGAAGMANLELGVPLAPDMIFRLGSITKQFTGAAIMLLAEQGKLSVDDPLSKFLPDYPAGDRITVEHLLTHTSGVFSYTGITGYMETEIRADLTLDELIAVFRDLALQFEPGERFEYSNSGYVLLGAIIEKASGQSYASFVEESIFKRLGMDSSSYGSRMRIIPRRAAGYDGGPGEHVNAPYLSMTQPHAAGSLLSSVDDLYRWNTALFGGKLLQPESVEQMTTPFRLNGGDESNYGYGLGIGEVRGHQAIRHGGGIHGFATSGIYLPEKDVYVAVLSNDPGSPVGPGTLATRLAALAASDPFETFEAVKVQPKVLSRYAGIYEIDDETRRVVSVEGGKLFTRRGNNPRLEALPASDIRFFYPGSLTYLEFLVDDSGEVTGMAVHQNGAKEAEQATKVSGEVPPAPDETADLVLVGGRVMDPESGLDAVRNVSISGGRITAISSEALEGKESVDVSGLVVAPGFIDLHAHGQDLFSSTLQAQDGVTTAMDLEIGVYPVDTWYATREGKSPINYGATASHIGVRVKVKEGLDVGHILVDPVFTGEAAGLTGWSHEPATAAEVEAMQGLLRQGLAQGALGVGFGINYTPGASREEILEMLRVAASEQVTSFVHVRHLSETEPGSTLEAVQEMIAGAATTGASVHIVHIGSSGLRKVPLLLDLIDRARGRGLDITTEVYPYTAASTFVNAAIFDPGWRERIGSDYNDLVMVDTGERLTEATFHRYRKEQPGALIIAHMMKDEMVAHAVAHPGVMIASDGMVFNDGQAHPRGAGTFSRVLGYYSRERGDLSLMDALEKMTLLPARRLENAVPQMSGKGRLRPRADADIVVFDPDTVRDRATFEDPDQPSAGIQHVLVGGTFVVRNTELVEGVYPGQGVRR